MSLHRISAFAARSLLFFGFWLLLLEPESLAPAAIGADWAVGVLAALAAALLSLRLLPPVAQTPRPWPLLHYLVRFFMQSLLAGFDVARRALDPRLPLAPGPLIHPTALPKGTTARTLFGAVSSQVPGTLAVDLDASDHLLYHCLYGPQEAARGLAADEALFLRMLPTDPEPPERPPS